MQHQIQNEARWSNTQLGQLAGDLAAAAASALNLVLHNVNLKYIVRSLVYLLWKYRIALPNPA
jgi:hypothetical protein